MILSSVFIFLFGLVIGSFLNAVIWRMYSRTPVWQGRSMCPACRHKLSWQDLIPVVSFFLLRGKCAYCAKPISPQYPLCELATGVLFLAIFLFLQPSLVELLSLWFLTASLIVIFVYDLKHFIIPDIVLYPTLGVTLFWRMIESLTFEHWGLIRNLTLEISNFEPLINYLLAGVGAATFFFVIHALSRGAWMGFGDVKLALLMGLMLGFPRIIVALFFAFVVGAALSLFLIFFRKKQWKSEVPFAPFLVLGSFLALFFGARIVNWYLNMFL